MSKNVKTGVLSALFAVYAASFAYIAMYSTPSGDDFTSLYALLSKGFWQAHIDYWLGWGGRFTSALIINIGYVLNVMEHYGSHVPFAICFTLLCLYFTINTLFRDIKTSSKLFFALLIQAAWLSTAVDLAQSLYWFNGFTYYLTSGVFLIEFLMIVKIYRGEASKLAVLMLGLVIIINSGMSEVSAAYHLPMYLGAALACWAGKRNRAAMFMLILFGIAILGFLLQIFNPGNATRVTQLYSLGPNPMPTTQNILQTYQVAVVSGLITVYNFFKDHLIIYTIFPFLPFIAKNVKLPDFVQNLPFKFKIWHICIFQLVTACCFQAIGGYSMGNFLYSRAMAPVFWIMFAQWLLFFLFLYRNEGLCERIKNTRIYEYRCWVFALLLLLSANSRALIHDYWIMPKYVSELNARFDYMAEQKALGNMDIILPWLNPDARPSLFIADSAPDYRRFGGYSKFYGFNSVREVYPRLLEAARNGGERAEIEQLVTLVNQEDVEAQVILAMYLDGSNLSSVSELIGKDDNLAWQLYYKAAKQGDSGSRNHLWTFYLGGIRTPHDAEIIRWGVLSAINPF